MPIIRKLTDKSADSASNGGKIQGLAKLQSHGFPVPKTFFISPKDADKLDSFGFHSELKDMLNSFSKGTKIAIRSSALGEDGAKKSFAGIFDTELNVDASNIDNVLAGIAKVVKSASSSKTQSYKSARPRKMGILIQEMVQPRFAGVAFTDSLGETGENVAFIEFVDGLGDKLVSGKSNSSRVTIPYDEKGTLDKSKIKFFNKNSGSDRITPVLGGLIDNLQKVREKFGQPMDTEWAIDDLGKTLMLQARPITKQVFVPVEHNFADAGIVASYGKGTVSGKTYFVDGELEEGKELDNAIAKMPNGAVLILTYSDTYYLPAMRKAKAIISTNGSILAHAAIVSRELGIPCIVGVKDADKHFPDGTKVSINPSKGEIVSEKYSVRGNNNDIEWGELNIYEHLSEIDLNGVKILAEKLNDGKIAIHLPEDIPNNFIDNVEAFVRKTYKQSPKIYQTDKYLWFYENKRFSNLSLFNEFVENGRKAVESMDNTVIKKYFQRLEDTERELVKRKKSIKDGAAKFLYDEIMQAIHFATSMRTAQGYAIEYIYNKVKPILERCKLNFIDFVSLKGDEQVLASHPELMRMLGNMRIFEKERNEIYQKLLDIGAVHPDYFSKRDRRAKRIMGLKSADKNAPQAVDLFYSSLDFSKKKANDITSLMQNHR
jgi:pyruvate,water dikinase